MGYPQKYWKRVSSLAVNLILTFQPVKFDGSRTISPTLILMAVRCHRYLCVWCRCARRHLQNDRWMNFIFSRGSSQAVNISENLARRYEVYPKRAVFREKLPVAASSALKQVAGDCLSNERRG